MVELQPGILPLEQLFATNMPRKKLSIPHPRVLTGDEMMNEASRVLRAEKENKRGIIRDRSGGIVFSKEQLKQRLDHFTNKEGMIEDRIKVAVGFKKEILKQRLDNLKVVIQQIKKELK